MRIRARAAALAAAAVIAATASALPASAGDDPPPTDRIDLDVLFVGAHPDDEAFNLAALGQWGELEGLATGVITVTRGEGGGNAAGLEEGPELGMLREAEERRAVAFAGIENVYNLDQPDFWFTFSAPLTTEVWGEDTLERVVRVMRATRPEVVVTMNPAPTNHGHHQMAARLAAEAYDAAADPEAFPAMTEAGLEPWAPARILLGGADGEAEPGPACETTPFPAADPTARVFGAWQGRVSEAAGETWAMRAWRAQIEYVSQGWSVFPPPPEDPAELPCNWFTLIDSRTPYPDPASGPTAALQGAAVPTPGGLPLGTRLDVAAERFEVLPGVPFSASVQVAAGDEGLTGAELAVTGPTGWAVELTGDVPADLEPGGETTVDATITPPANATPGARVTLAATLTTGDGASGTNETAVAVTGEVSGSLVPRSEDVLFNEWAASQGLDRLQALVTPSATVGAGGSADLEVEVTNNTGDSAGGTVRLELPAGFEAAPAEHAYELAAGETATVTFAVTNTDASLPAANQAPDGGYPFQVVTTSGAGAFAQDAVVELVPTTVVPLLDTTPEVDGRADHTEYPGAALDTSTLWEGDEATPEDVSATTRISTDGEALFVYVDVTDEAMGTVVPPVDCKRHWRTDSVEITVDPRGTSPNTASTFKTGTFPVTDDPAAGDPPCFQRDADNHQGRGEETAPGMEVASVVRDAGGYTVEAMIPYDVLPDTVDPERMGLNVLVYDSDTQDLTGQTRVGWSTFGGVQATPYRWGLATVPGLEPSGPAPVEPTIPDTAALSVNSPQSIAQSAADGVPLGGGPGLPADALQVTAAEVSGGEVRVDLDSTAAGQANLFAWDGEQVLGEAREAELPGGPATVTVPVSGEGTREVLTAFTTGEGTLAVAHPL